MQYVDKIFSCFYIYVIVVSMLLPIFVHMKRILNLILYFTTTATILSAQGVDSTKVRLVDSYVQKAQSFFSTGNVDSILHYYGVALTEAKKDALTGKVADVYHEYGKLYLMLNNQDSALNNFAREANVARNSKNWMSLNKALGQMASICYTQGKNVEGLPYAKEAIEAGINAKYDRGTGIGYLQAGNLLLNLARNEEALQHYLNASKSFEKCDFQAGVASCWNNMAGIYYTLEKFDLAIEYYRKAMELQRSLGNMSEYAQGLLNIGTIYSGFNRKDVVTPYRHRDSMFYYYKESERTFNELKDTLNIVRSRLNLGIAYMVEKDWNLSKKYLDAAYPIAISHNYMSDIISIENAYALLNQRMGNFEKSKEYFLKVYPRIMNSNFKEKEFMWYRDMALTLDSLGDYEAALRSYERYVQLYDTVRAREADEQMNQLAARYGSELKDQEIAAAKERQILMSREQDALRKRFLIMVGAAIIIGIFLIFVVYLFIQKRKANKLLEQQNNQIAAQNVEIERQRNEVVAQKEQIELQQQNILDSIHYASRIQSAILPQREVVGDMFGEKLFILFKPRDIVSGDFFWIGKKGVWKIAIAADCTGHGVPGAFMSMLGTAFLNEIINDPTIDDIPAGVILNKLRENIIKALKQTGKAGEQKDGMDLSMWMFNEGTKIVRFAGANNPLVIVRKNVVENAVEDSERIKLQEFVSETNSETYQIIQLAGSKMPIGIYADMQPFEDITMQLYPGDTLYSFSDGFQDQFGGEKGKKFMIKRLKQIFVNIYESPMHEQREQLDHELVTWIEKGNTEQIDDVLVIGYRV